ncbi:RNR alpha [EBPR siphovirus 2]|nr:RNR alpha [EBPR siphovirus 2]
MNFPYPFVIVVSDGKNIRSLKSAHLGRHAPMVEAALADLLLETSADPSVVPVVPTAVTEMGTQSEIARAQGYTGDACTNCQQFKMKQAGHCMVCDACGTTTGCS